LLLSFCLFPQALADFSSSPRYYFNQFQHAKQCQNFTATTLSEAFDMHSLWIRCTGEIEDPQTIVVVPVYKNVARNDSAIIVA
jgi:hypothetical protein